MKRRLWEKLKYHLWGRALFSNKFYHLFLRSFDRILFEVVPAEDLIKERKRQIPLNKICQAADQHNPVWSCVLSELKMRMDEKSFHRKAWEHVQIVFSLKRMKLLTPDSVCLAVGAGRENLLYYLTHKVNKVCGIDLYEGDYFGGEDEADIPLSAKKYAPFPYPEDKLNLLRMNALDLEFNDRFFDFIFSSSSIEHFGSEKEILKSLKEMYRVLKPGGAALLTTELRLNKLGSSLKNTQVFPFQDLLSLFMKAGFIVREDFDLRIENKYLDNWIKLPDDVFKRPHVILRYFNTILTSIHAVLLKPGRNGKKGREIFPVIPDYIYRGHIHVSVSKAAVHRKESLILNISLKNSSNFTWVPSGFSHRISLGVKLLTENNQLVERDYLTLTLPKEMAPEERIEFSAQVKAPPQKGSWILRFDLKKELVLWFSQKGNPCFDLKIKVS
ncbi:MAG: methyltransferase domain-containing protein [Candidatus Aminicenantes bacterium]|nr:methyltransferase domain-containing protein [Candidatus Aminicenantes bacterium]